MHIETLELQNVGQFQSLTAPLAPTSSVSSNVTILIGNNGTGKTTILQSLATALSWFVARIRSDKGSGSAISEQLITNDATSAAIKIRLSDLSDTFDWTLAKVRAGRKGEHGSQFDGANRLADTYRTALSNDAATSLPLIAFYSVERAVLDVSLKLKGKRTFSQLDGYDNSLRQGVDFARFFEWFREREDWENEEGVSLAMEAFARNAPDKLRDLMDLVENGGRRIENLEEFDFHGLRAVAAQTSDAFRVIKALQDGGRDPQLQAVRRAIAAFMPGFENLKVRRKPRLHMSVDKQGRKFDVLQLSQGEKSLMALIGDIARRLAMMNPSLEDPLLGNGVVLIDEVDMHLHPQWASNIVDRLRSTFPNCQFVLTTHSPLVISDCKDVLVYSLENGALAELQPLYGEDANTVLLSAMNTHPRTAEVAKQLNDLLDLIQAGELETAQRLLAALREDLPPDNLELAKAGLLLRKREHRAKN